MAEHGNTVKFVQALAIAERAAAPRNALEAIMADDPTKTGLDRQLISLDEPHEIRDWCSALNCTEPQLREAVHAAGTSAAAVRDYLQKSGVN